MEYNYPAQYTAASPNQQPIVPGQQPLQQQAPAAPRGRGRRQYAAQQYDFNAPAPDAMYAQQRPPQQYQVPGYQQGQPVAPVTAAPQQYGQPHGYPQPGYQYGQDYQAPSPSAYQQNFQGQQGISGMTNQLQQMHVSQVSLFPLDYY